MVGFDDGSEQRRILDRQTVATIHSDLSYGVDVTRAKRLKDNEGISFIGTQKTGPLDLTPDQARTMIANTGNPNNRPNTDVIKPWINGLDITRRPRNMWIIDFGTDMSLEVWPESGGSRVSGYTWGQQV